MAYAYLLGMVWISNFSEYICEVNMSNIGGSPCLFGCCCFVVNFDNNNQAKSKVTYGHACPTLILV